VSRVDGRRAAAREALIRLSGVTKRYDAGADPALDAVSLTVGSAEAVAVMGPSGSGKSTLLNLIAGLDKPSGGSVTVVGERVDEMGETAAARFRRREIGMIFQFFNLLEDLTVQDNVLLPAQLAGGTPWTSPHSRERAAARIAPLRADGGRLSHAPNAAHTGGYARRFVLHA